MVDSRRIGVETFQREQGTWLTAPEAVTDLDELGCGALGPRTARAGGRSPRGCAPTASSQQPAAAVALVCQLLPTHA